MTQLTYKKDEIQTKDGRFVLPPELAEKLDLQPGDRLRVLMGDQGTMVLEKANQVDKAETGD